MKYVKKSLVGKIPYHSKKISDGIIMNANESAFETPNEIIELIKDELDNIDLRRYPNTDNNFVRNELAKAYGININNLTIGVGSDQLLDCVFRSLIDDEYILSCRPTFSMYKEYASYTNGKFIDIDFLPGFIFDVESIIKNIDKFKPKLVIICSPNNPTGSVIERNDLELIINKTDGVVLLDEAYSEFYKSNYDLGLKYENVIVLKTFSKAYALAGIRVGYAISSEDLINTINICKPPYNVSTISNIIAGMAIKNRYLYKDNIKKIIKLKNELYDSLCMLGLNPIRSYSNFIFVKLNDVIYKHLLGKKIYIRRLEHNGEFWHRINTGTAEENKILVQTIREVL